MKRNEIKMKESKWKEIMKIIMKKIIIMISMKIMKWRNNEIMAI